MQEQLEEKRARYERGEGTKFDYMKARAVLEKRLQLQSEVDSA
ncbi:hypothetical protein TrRE_jg8175, partial [Triparma retinervis]